MEQSSNELSYELQQLSGWLFDGRYGYSLGYLIRKLPEFVLSGFDSHGMKYVAKAFDEKYTQYADTPEDCAAKLAIKLFKSGILTKEGKD